MFISSHKSTKRFCSFIFTLSFLFFSIPVLAQDNERDKGLSLINQGNYSEAISILKKSVKNKNADSDDWYYLGLAYFKKGDSKGAIKSFQKSVELNPTSLRTHDGLGFAYLMKNLLNDAGDQARKALELNQNDPNAHYILGVIGFRNGAFDKAYEKGNLVIKLNPNFTDAYLLVTGSLVSSFVKQSGTVLKSADSRDQLLREASVSLEKYLNLAPSNQQTTYYRDYLDSIKFFADYYSQPANKPPADPSAESAAASDATGVKITAKPRADYTNSARENGISGTVELMVEFSPDGQVKHVIVLRSLGYGLDEEAISAVRRIKFEPATRNDVRVSSVKRVQYSFSIF